MMIWKKGKDSFLIFLGIAFGAMFLLYYLAPLSKSSFQTLNEFIVNEAINRIIPSNRTILDNPVVRLDNRSFEENNLFYYNKITQTEELPLSLYNANETKRILVWTLPFGDLPGYLVNISLTYYNRIS